MQRTHFSLHRAKSAKRPFNSDFGDNKETHAEDTCILDCASINTMADFISVFLIAAVLVKSTLSSSQQISPLNGHHLRVLGIEILSALSLKQNNTGHVIHVDGALKHVLDSLSIMFNFTYSFVPLPNNQKTYFDDLPFGKGGVSYLTNNEADYVLGAILLNPSRFQKADFPSSWYYAPFGCIVPYPREKPNITAVLDPLSYQVWILIIISIFAVTLYLYLIGYKALSAFPKNPSEACLKVSNVSNIRHSRYVFDFVMGNLVSQGQICHSERLSFRVAGGAWCLGCFFLIQIYSSTLTSHLTSPNLKPIVSSFYDIANTPGVRLTVDKGFAMDNILKQSDTHTEYMKRLSVMMSSDPGLRCNKTSDCLKKVKAGHAVYSAPVPNLKMIVDEDLKTSNNMCHYTMLKETFLSSSTFTVLRKNSPYTESISRGILRLTETGLGEKWMSLYVPSSPKCMKLNKRDQKKSRLAVGHLSGVFGLLFGGYILAIVIFSSEKIYAMIRSKVDIIIL